jgi:pimeloyl-ACP methyl ester carboxylesterase
MIPDAFYFSDEYANLKMPVVIVAGNEDRLVDVDTQSSRLHSDISQSTFHRVPGSGHMVHQTATSAVMAAIDEAAEDGQAADSSPNPPVTQSAA